MIGLDARLLCVRTLIRSIESKSYSNLALTQALMDAARIFGRYPIDTDLLNADL